MHPIALALVVLVTACQYSTSQRQVGLVPPPRATMYDGQPIPKQTRIEGRATTVVMARDLGDSADHSAFVARDVFGGGVFTMVGGTELGASVDSIRTRSSSPMTTQVVNARAPVDNGYALALALRRSMLLEDGWAIGFAGELGWTEVPIVREDGLSTSDTAALYRLGIVPSYRRGAVTVFASLQLTNDTIVPGMVDVDFGTKADASARSAVLIPTVGAAVRVGEDVRLMAQLAQPFNTTQPYNSTVDHGMQLEVSLGYELGDRTPSPHPR